MKEKTNANFGILAVLLGMLVGAILPANVAAEPAILVWHAYTAPGDLGSRAVTSERCSVNAGEGWIEGGCPANRTFALICYTYSTYATLASEFNFSTSTKVMRAALGGVPSVTVANTWSDFIGTGPLVNTMGAGSSFYWAGNDGQGVAPNRFNCNDWQNQTDPVVGYMNGGTASEACNYFAASNYFCINGAYGSGCASSRAVFCGCYVDAVATNRPSRAPSRAPSRTPSRSPSLPTPAPTRREIMMVSTTATAGGCGASTPDTQPFARADGTCIPSGFNTAVKATCTGGTPRVTLFTNDDGTCTSPTNSSFPTSCQSVTGPGPFGGSITMGFGMACTEYKPEDLLQVTVYSGSCAVKSEPMVTYMVLNTCIRPPGLPIGGTIVRPPVSFRLQAFGTQNNVFVKVQSWNNGVCQGGASAENTMKLEAVAGGAATGCIEGNPHGFTGAGKDLSRRLSTVATEIKLHAIPASLPESPSAAGNLQAPIGTLVLLSVATMMLWISV